eukprot:c13534_g1_i1 orf=525-2174(+)
MNKQESPPPSWLLRTHFSRAIYYRPGTCDISHTCVNLPPKEVTFLPGRSRAKDLHNDPVSIKQSQSLDALSGASPGNPNNEEKAQGVDFSFPSPLPSSPTGGLSDSSLHSRSTLDCFSPTSDDDASANSTQAVRPSCSMSNGLLGYMLNTLSVSSSRWSVTTDSFNGNREHSPSSSFKDSCFSWVSPKASPKSSPRVSPVVSPRGSPRSSFRYSTSTKGSDDSVRSESRSDMHRVPSWSQHLSCAGNERAVLSAEKWMVDLSQLLLGERFAYGNHSRIYHGMYKDSPVAVKVIRQPDADVLQAERLEQVFTNEVTMLSISHHRHIIKFVAACKKPPVLCVITEYLSGGSVRSFLHKREGKPLPIRQVLHMALNIASGMEYLHMKGVIHRDLKSENLALGEDGCVKILDFGVSCFESHCDYKADDPGTYRWMAPEMLSHKPYTKMVDVYSFGIVLWELLTARVPYEEMGAVQAAFCVIHKNLRPSIPSDCVPALEELMCSCWSKEPKERPEFWQIMRSLTLCEQSLDTSKIPTLESPEHYASMPTWLHSE